MQSDLPTLDPVTGSHSLTWFLHEADKLIGAGSDSFAVVSFDVCDFKVINLTLGYEAGNRMLCHIQHAIDDMLEPGEFAIHDKADVFYALLKSHDRHRLLDRLNTMRTQLDSTVLAEMAHAPYLEMRCGIYLADTGEASVQHMIECANMARKHSPGNTTFSEHCFYDPSIAALKLEEKERIALLIEALENHEFDIHLQPKVSLKDGRIAGAEALVRWLSPVFGTVLPGKFIPILERYHLIHRIDLLVFEKVCQLIARWHREGRTPFPISLNLSCQSIEIPNILQHMTGICERYGVRPDEIEIEITETSFLENVNYVKDFVKELRSLGFLCSIDDFGCGYSSLGSLKVLPVDSIKLDRSFFKDSEEYNKARIIVHSMTTLAKALGFDTVAEGIETDVQLQHLKETCCDLVQGFVFFRPMPVDRFEAAAYRTTPTAHA